MAGFTFKDTVSLTTVAIRVKDRDKMIAFYKDLVGFHLQGEENALAIMGIAKTKREDLWLEESPRANDYAGETKRLKQLSLHIGHLLELADLFERFTNAKYPKMKVNFLEKSVHLYIDDPEENRLDIYTEIEEPLTTVEQLREKSSGKYPSLSEQTSFDHIALHVSDKKEEEEFLSTALGFQTKTDVYTLTLDNRFLGISLQEKAEKALLVSADDITGLEVVKLKITSDDLRALEESLNRAEKTFYIDSKKTILAVNDPAGVQWWYSIK